MLEVAFLYLYVFSGIKRGARALPGPILNHNQMHQNTGVCNLYVTLTMFYVNYILCAVCPFKLQCFYKKICRKW